MTAPEGCQWRRDKDGLGVWEHRGKVAVAGVGHSPVDRRWDGVSMDKTLGAYSILACRKAPCVPGARTPTTTPAAHANGRHPGAITAATISSTSSRTVSTA